MPLTYMEGGVEHVLDHWEEQVEASRDESGTLSFGLYQDRRTRIGSTLLPHTRVKII